MYAAIPWYVVLGIFTLIGKTTKQEHLVSSQSEAVTCKTVHRDVHTMIILHRQLHNNNINNINNNNMPTSFLP